MLQNGILLPSLRPALPFLDLHGVMRLEFHQSVMEELRERLLQRIREIANSSDKNKYKLLNELLAKSFAVVRVKELRPVIMCLLQHLPKIEREYLLVIVQDRELYMEAPVEVKQHIWQDNQALFGDEVSPLLSRYIDMKESCLFDTNTPLPVFFSAVPKTRRQADVVQELTKMIGRNIRLYDMVLQFLRTLFMRTRNVHYCMLRAELLMAVHDADIQEITSADPCHKFTWCLDACIRDRLVDTKRMRELHGFLDSMAGYHQQQVLGDLAMILCDSQAVEVLAVTIMKLLHQCSNSDLLPRQNDDLLFALRMLSLGLGAWQIIDSQVFTEPKLESSVVTRLLAVLVGFMVDDQLSSLATGKDDLLTNKTDPLPRCIRGSGVRTGDAMASTLFVHYVLLVARQSNVSSVMRLLPLLSAHYDADVVYSDTALHSLVSALCSAPLSDAFANIDFCDVVFTKFFVPQISRENVLRHVIRLLCWVHQHIDSPVLEQLLKSVQPTRQHGDIVHAAYQTLLDNIAAASSAAPASDKQPPSLMSPL